MCSGRLTKFNKQCKQHHAYTTNSAFAFFLFVWGGRRAGRAANQTSVIQSTISKYHTYEFTTPLCTISRRLPTVGVSKYLLDTARESGKGLCVVAESNMNKFNKNSARYDDHGVIRTHNFFWCGNTELNCSPGEHECGQEQRR